mgnify:CR=1 FL=1
MSNNSNLRNPEQWLVDAFLGGLSSRSGVNVTELTALGVPTVYSCVHVISDTLATLPVTLYKKNLDGTKERVTDHHTVGLIDGKPNVEMTSIDMMGAMTWNLCLRNRSYILINRDGGDRPAELWPIEPHRVTTQRQGQTGTLQYYIDGQTVSSRNLVHFRGPTVNGIASVDPLQVGRDSIGLAIALADSASDFFKNGSRLGNVYSANGELSDAAISRLQKQLKERREKGRDYTDLFLEEGMRLIQTRAQNRDSQFLESRKYQDERIAAIYKVPPHKVGILDRSTNNNIEHQGIEFVTDTILPWARRVEKTLGAYLLTDAEKAEGYFYEFLIDGLARGDLKTRFEAYAVAIQNGWMNRNEVRKKENMNPFDGGDEYLQQLNMVPVGAETDEEEI